MLEAETCRRSGLRLVWMLLVAVVVAGAWQGAASAQHKGQPGQFDFFLLNLPWAPEFCAIEGTGPGCAAHGAFVVHGLWPQNADGTWPVYCAERPGPRDPRANLDITPDLSLLQHEWAKHGTCTTLSPEQFFAEEHRAFAEVRVPRALAGLRQTTRMRPEAVISLFAAANPQFAKGSFAVSCRENRLSAVEVCLSKALRPIKCEGIKSCRAGEIVVQGPGQ